MRGRASRAGVRIAALAAVALWAAVVVPAGQAARLKDIAVIGGTRSNPLIGYGLVVGLNGTGDSDTATFTLQSLTNMLQNFRVSTPKSNLKVKNVAAVMVTADLPSFAKKGWRMDVVISSLGDASSLAGGTLLMTPLSAPTGEVYAVAQGSVLVGGFQSSGQSGSSVQKNHTTVGRIPGGAVVEAEIPVPSWDNSVQVLLTQPDYATAARAAAAINRRMGRDLARAKDGSEILVDVPANAKGRMIDYLAEIGEVDVDPDCAARVVVNEKTGTVVIGQNVRISKVALSHGALNIVIRETPTVSQPEPLSAGRTTVTPSSEVSVKEESGKVALVDSGPNIADLVNVLNRLGVTPRDLISILQALKQAGALQAELSVM